MSELTHAEFLRSVARELKYGRERRIIAIADLLDATQWRDEPPDSPGEWLRRVPGDRTLDSYDITAGMIPMQPSKHRGLLVPGCLWLKLPPTVVPAGSGTPQAVRPGE